jgi:fructan beta-fructosidase
VQLGWLQTATPGMPFNQGMSLPLTLGLRKTANGPRLTWSPVEELKALRVRKILNKTGTIGPGDSSRTGAKGELIELRAVFDTDTKSVLTLNVRGVSIVHDAGKREMRVGDLAVPLPRAREKQRLVIYADRTSLEVFADGGLIYVPLPHNFDSENSSVDVKVTEAAITFDSLEAYELSSAWGSQ